MSAGSKIEWTDHTFNPWWGCTKVSPGCDHCYAETQARRWGTKWGTDAERRTFGADHWAEPLAWNAAAEREGKRRRVFCASMADLFEPDAPAGELARLWALIRVTPWLDWQLLTKRPQFIAKNLPDDWGAGYPNVWLGTSVESQDYAWRIEKLLAVPAVVRFLSCEPLLGPLDFSLVTHGEDWREVQALDPRPGLGLHWVIFGGESGPGARPLDVAWIRDGVAQCRAAGVPVFVKQLGAKPYEEHGPPAAVEIARRTGAGPVVAFFPRLADRKGGDMAEWPADLQVREFPAVRA